MTRPLSGSAPRTRLPTAQRRAQLADAAGRLFRLRGFHQVSMADVAGAVGITAPALYRHYADKQELLAAAVGGALDVVEEALARAPEVPLDAFLDVMAGAAVAEHDLWVLLQRELRHVDADRRAALDRRFGALARRFTAAIARDRPALTGTQARFCATGALAVLASPSTHRREPDPARHGAVLAAAALAASRARWATGGRSDAPARPAPGGRSEQLLDTAVGLFAARGYQAVSLDDIAAELGMAGPSIYHWYPTKADLLVAAFSAAGDRLTARHTSPADLDDLDDLVAGYVELGLADRLLFAVYVLEAKNLPPEAARRVRQALAADVTAWLVALSRARPELPADQALVLVHAARAVVQDVVRLGRWHEHPDTPTALRATVQAVLDTPVVDR
ncbi:transcriptional regulator, TetR family [Klenkia soli]|uniref:Transcriptional regulator, TetR family n=1 Tax=Klenkia soli TaxID=1052260 RepID=A0A1H0SKV4_9ACTN|nr:TetR/AcrR family transcriptional regulator [Klenkia soli]SDP42159.1 transcriptional regulator, TetR family [Klenkia soli]